MALQPFDGELDQPRGLTPFEGKLDGEFAGHEAVPEATAGSVARDVAAGALKIGPTFLKGVGDVSQLATSGAIGSGLSGSMQRGMDSIDQLVGSERAAAQKRNFERDMADDSVGIGEALARNKGALADQLLPTVGSMFLPVGVAGGAGKLATVGQAAQALDKAALAARVARVQKVAGIGTITAQNAADTFTEQLEKGASLEDAYISAGITVPFSVVAGAVTGGGAEGQIARNLFNKSAAGKAASELLKAPLREGVQEVGEEAGQILGDAYGARELPSATGAGKRLAVAGTLGAAMGGGAHVATMGRGGAGEERGDGTRPTDDGLQPDGTYKVTVTGTGDGQAPAAAPAAADFDYSTYPAYRRALESGGVADAKNPNSSAYGADQFTRGTWLDTVAQAKPEWAVGMSKAELLAQRANPERSAEMATFFDQQNALALRKAGQEVNQHTLYAMHHFGKRGIGFAKASGDTPMSGILSPAQMEANAYLKGKTKNQAIANWDQRAAGAAPAGQAAPSAQAEPQQAEPQTDLAAAGEQTSEAALKPSRELTALDRAVALDNEAARLRERLDAVNRGGSDPEPARTLTQRLADIEAEVGAIKADWPPMQVGRAASFTTEAGVRLEGHYALVDASQLITSHDENLRQNPAYPQALQPRQRDRAASEMQISGIVGRLDPTRLGLSADAATGAPIVGADGLVESGNARTIALKRVYQAGGQKAADYKAFLESSANEFGVDPEQVRGMAEPVLVRVRDTPVDRAEFARQANASTVAAMSPSEQAKADAARIDSMEDLTPDDAGDFTNAGSRSFVRRFMGRLPATEQAAMVDASGALSSAGYARVRNAVLAKAYGDSPVIQRMTESLDDNVKNLTKALMMAAPEVAKMRAAMEAGARFDVDITADVVAAVEELARLKDDGISVHDALAQAGMFGDKYSPETRELMQFLADNTRRPRRIADFLKAYYQALDEAGDPNQGSLLGETEAPAKGDLLQAAQRAANDEGEQDATSRSDRAKPPEGGGAQGPKPGQQDRGQREAAGGREEGAQDHQDTTRVQAGRVGEWVAFPQEDGSIGIPRARMPQIKSADRSAFLQFLQARGIDNEKGSINAADLKPTQAEFSAKKVERLVRKPEALGDRSVLVSSDGHVLDGHHQWMARRILGQEIPVIQIDAPIRALLDATNEFPSVKRSEGADNVTDLQARRASAVADFKAAMADLADLATKHQRAAMVPEQVPGLVETLAKLFDAAIRIVGTDVRAATKWVRQQLRANKATRKLYAEIDPAILRKAAERAAANMAPASGPAQAGLFDSLEDASTAVQGDLFSPAAQAPQEARIPAARTITSFDRIPRLELFVSVEVLAEARDVASGLKESGETHAISDAERAEAEALMKPRLERAAQAKDDYDAKVREAARSVGGGYLLAPLKGMNRIVEKLTDPDERDENGNLDPDGIKDLLRSTIVVDDYGDAQAALDAIAERFNVIRVKNRIPDEVRAKFAGYADVLVNIRTDNGTVAEIQINVPSMLASKNDVGHVLYEVARSPASRQEARDRARELMRGLYDVAYEAGLSRGRTPGLKSLALRTADRNPASDMGAALRSGSRETGFSSSPSSDSLNTLPSGKETNSSPENEATNSQPAGNLSGTFINTSDRDIITGKSTPVDGAAAGNGPESNGITEGGASADSQRDVSPGAQGARPGAVSSVGEGRQAGGARHQGGERRQRRNRAGDDAGRAGAGLPQAAADGADQAQQRGAGRSAGARSGRAAGVPVAREIPAKTGRNYSFDNEGDLAYEGSWAQKARANVEAVELLKRLTDEGRQATPEEQAVLARFVGWGASELANTIFSERWARATEAKASASDGVREALANSGGTLDGKHPSYYRAWSLMPDAKKPATFRYGMPISASDVVLVKPAELRMLELRDRLKKVMAPKEWREAERTTQYGHYTSKAVVKSMWNAMERMGFKGGAVLEPGAGIGVFPGLMPAALANNSIYTGVEYDSFTGGILKQLQPDERIVIDGYQNVKLPAGFYDVAIGNPPFADVPVLTDTEYKRHAFSLHDYFFAKTIDRLKPGGLMAFVTSRYTMDKLNDKARSYLADKADLVGAIRLPQTAFKQNAGTEVITDVIFLRKRVEGEQFDQGQDWQKSVPVTVDGQTYNVNEYFVAHPEMVLGTISSRGSMYAANEYTVLPGDKSIDDAFAEAVARLPADIYRPEIGSAAAAAQVREIDFNPKAGKEGNFYVSDAGVLMQRENGQGMRVEGLSASDARIVADYVPLRDALKQAQYDQLNGGDWETSLRALQGAYREFTGKHGRLWQFKTRKRTVTVTDPDTGETFKDTEETRWFPLHKLLRSDPDNTVVLALEKFNDDTGEISDGDMLKGRVLDVTKPPVIETPTDAMLSVLNDVGHVDIGMIADRVGMDASQAIEALGTAIYQQPGGEWQTADEYLSGNVKEKLRAAREATKSDERFQRNVDALEAVQPLPKGPEDINIALGMNWIRPQEYSNFLRDLTGMDVEVTRAPTGDWLVKALSRPTPEAMSDWGTQDRPADDLLQSALNGSPVRVTKTDPQTKASRVDEAGTEAANAKLLQLQERFSTWVWEDAKRSDAIVRTYNDKFNTTIPRSFDGRHLRLPGTSSLMTIFDHVKRGAWRIIQTGNTYLAHAVGSGKTFQMVISAMEQKRLGLIKKPMMVVPNHMLQQFATEWLQLYPAARLMVADEENFHTDNRRRFVSRVALSDLDGVIITQSAFKLIDTSPEFKAKIVEEQLEFLRASLYEVDQEAWADEKKAKKSRDPTVKQIQRQIERLEERLTAAMEGGKKKDKNILFEELGVDMLYVDEAHGYRKLDFATKRQMKGIQPAGSIAALDLYTKARYLDEKRPGRSIVMASGTPITNTLAELYSVQRFMDRTGLEERGLESFDDWAAQHGRMTTELEPNAAGRYEPVSRFSKFVNLSDLTMAFRKFADVLTSDDLAAVLGDKRPKVVDGGRRLVLTPKTEGYAEYQKKLADRMEKSRAWKPSKDEPNNPDPLIRIIGDGRLAAIDMRFVDPQAENDPNSKLNQMADAVIQRLQETADNTYVDKRTGEIEPIKGGALMVFSDIGFGAGVAKSRGFNGRAWFEKRLRDGGVDMKQVAFMSDYKKSRDKLNLFADVNAGKVRLLVGTSKNMGTGVNAQQRLTGVFHLDPTWYPADIEQREGRAVRQGNKNKEVDLVAFAAKGSYDENMWKMIARKDLFINQIMTNDGSVNEVEDVSVGSDYSVLAAMVAENPKVLELAGAEADMKRMERLYQAHEQGRAAFRERHDSAKLAMEAAQHGMAAAEKHAKEAPDLSGDNFVATVGRQKYTGRADWGKALIERFADLSAQATFGTEAIGKIGGFDVTFEGYKVAGGGYNADVSMKLPLERSGRVTLVSSQGDSPVGAAMRAQNAIAELRRVPEKMRETIEQSKATMESLRTRLDAPFPMAQMLVDARASVKRLREELAAEGEPDAGGEPDGQVKASRQADARGAKVTAIRAALRKAYGGLVDSLEHNGVVTLTQSMDEAVEAAAQARALITGRSDDAERSRLMASVNNSKRVVPDVGAVLRQADDPSSNDSVEVKFGAVASELAGLLQAHQGVDVSGFEHAMDSSVVRHARKEHSNAARERSRGQLPVTDEDLRAAPLVILSPDRYVLGAKDGRGSDLVGYVRAMPDGTVLYIEEVRTGRRTLSFKSIRKYPAASNVDAVAQTLALNARNDGGDVQIIASQNPDIKRSTGGAVEGFHDPVTGRSFLIADALTEQTAPGTLMHEVGVHMAEQGVLAKMIRRGEQLRADSPRAPVVRDAIRRMEQAGETSGEEFVAYLVTEYENQRAVAPRAVRQLIVDLLAAARAWLHSKGWVATDRLTVADLAAIARANARAVARGRAATRSAAAPALSRSEGTKAAYEARIDALFDGDRPRARGVRLLDRSDMLGLLRISDGPVHVVEGKVDQGRFNHRLTAADWKRIPDWLDNPAAVFDSDTVPGRLVFIAPEKIEGDPVRMIVESRADGDGVNLLINAYDAERNPFARWEREGLLRYVDTKKSASVLGSFQPRLTGLPGSKRPGRILTEKNLAGWRRANPQGAAEAPAFSRAANPAAAPALDAEQRAQDIIDDKVKSVRPLDALTRAVTRYTGIEALTRGAGRLTARALDRMTPETIKAGLVSDFGVPEDAINARVLKQGRILMQMRKTGTLLERLATMTNAEAELAYAWMTGESPTAAMDAIAKLPAEQVRVLQKFRETVDKLGQDAVDAGLLSERTYRRNRGAYLHRSYEKHVLDEAAGKPRGGGRRATAVLGQNLHRRGIDITADMNAVHQTAPEWWDVARKAGKADPDLIGRRLIRMQRRANAGDGTLPLEGMEARGAGRVLETAYLPADKPIPAKYAEWTHAGEWEVRDVRGQELGLWRDYTTEERKRMGEIRDVRFAIAKTMQGMVQDVETARYFSWVAKNYAKPKGATIEGNIAQASEGLLRAFGRDEWVQVPETKVAGTGALKYGALAGKFVPGPIWNDIRHQTRHGLVADNVLGRGWDMAMRLFKTSKTAWSPTVHVNNIVSNFVMMDWNDVSAQHVAKAMGILMAAHDQRGVGAIGRAGNALARGLGIADRDAASEIVARFKESGGELGNWVVNESVEKALEGPLAQLQKDLADDPNGAGAQIGVMAALQHLKEGRLGDGGRALWDSKPVAVTRQELGNMTELYNSEDSVFRLAAWLQAKEEGKSDIEAGKEARRAFMDYEINAPWIQLAKNTGLPFLSFTYRGLPLLLNTMSRNPHKIVKLMAIFGALNQLGLMLAGGDDDDEVRRLLPDEKAGGLWGLVPKLIRMPWNDANDSPVYLDVRRWVPLGDIVDVGQGHAALPVPPSLMPGGPLAIAGELWANKSAFTGKPITLETDTPAEAAEKVAGHLYKAFTPNIVGLPGTYAFANVANAIKGKTDTFGREQSVAMALAGSFGVKLGAYPTDTLRRNTALGADIKTREIKAGIRAIQRQVQLGGLSAEDGQKQVDAQVRKIERLREKTLEKMGTD